MSQKEYLKLLKSWIEESQNMIRKNLNIQKQFFNQFGLEPLLDTHAHYEEGIFYIIDPYFIRKFKGFIIEKEGTLTIDEWELLEQTFYQKDDCLDNIIKYIDSHFEENHAYIINECKKGNVQYQQTKNEFGIYGPSLETTHYLKIGRIDKRQEPDSKLEEQFRVTYQMTEFGKSIFSVKSYQTEAKTIVKSYR